jgi:hypothetical protein
LFSSFLFVQGAIGRGGPVALSIPMVVYPLKRSIFVRLAERRIKVSAIHRAYAFQLRGQRDPFAGFRRIPSPSR